MVDVVDEKTITKYVNLGDMEYDEDITMVGPRNPNPPCSTKSFAL